MKMLPLFGLSDPVISLNIVVLPAQFCHIIVILDPLRTEKQTSSRIGLVNTKSKLTLSNLITVSFGAM
jgi:hypothetical protein